LKFLKFHIIFVVQIYNMSTLVKKSQAAIDGGYLTREEAAEYMGMSLSAFNQIAKYIDHARLGEPGRLNSTKHYTKKALLAYLAKVQQISKNTTQPIEN